MLLPYFFFSNLSNLWKPKEIPQKSIVWSQWIKQIFLNLCVPFFLFFVVVFFVFSSPSYGGLEKCKEALPLPLIGPQGNIRFGSSNAPIMEWIWRLIKNGAEQKRRQLSEQISVVCSHSWQVLERKSGRRNSAFEQSAIRFYKYLRDKNVTCPFASIRVLSRILSPVSRSNCFKHLNPAQLFNAGRAHIPGDAPGGLFPRWRVLSAFASVENKGILSYMC